MSEESVNSVEDFRNVLRKVAKVSTNELEHSLRTLRFDPKEHKTFRNFFYKIKSLVSSQLPAGTPAQTIASVALREFRTKVPRSVQSEPFFLCDDSPDPEKVIMKAQAIYDKTRTGTY